MVLQKAQIQSYLSNPLIANFDGLEEEVAKFLIIWYHCNNIWLSKSIEINDTLIHQNHEVASTRCRGSNNQKPVGFGRIIYWHNTM